MKIALVGNLSSAIGSVLANTQPALLAYKKPVTEDKKPIIPMDQTTAKSNCRHCHGRGHVGKDTKTGNMIKCRCLRKANKATKVQGKQVDSKTGW